MDAIGEALRLSPIPIENLHFSDDMSGMSRHIIVSCELADLAQGLSFQQSKQVDNMLKQLIDIACTVISTDDTLNKISLEMSYSSYNDWLDQIGTIISIERTKCVGNNNCQNEQLRIERYDPVIMDTIITYRDMYEFDLMNQLNSVRL
jgi:hypothetical protein